ncbi:MAG: Calx-beta domain-containing protein [Roseburia sp.]
MKKRIRRFIAGILAGIMVVTIMPEVPAKAQEFYTESYSYDLDTMKTQILESEEAKNYSNGAVTFPGSATSVNVGSELVYHLFRQGNTEKEQTVTIITQDITAGYGDDYELVVDGKVLDGKANVLLNGTGVTYDVYLNTDPSGNTGESTVDETGNEDSDLAVDMDQVKEDASCTFDLTFAEGEQVKEIRVRAKMPEKAVGNKEFQFIICECKDDLETGEYNTSVVTLIETRETEDAVVSLVEGSEEVEDGYVTVLVERTGNTNGYTSYDLKAEDGTAVNGEDYIFSGTELLFSPGVSVQRVHIPLVSADSEEEKTFTLRTENSEEEITYTTTLVGAAASFTQTRGVIDISMDEFVKGSYTNLVDGITFQCEEDESRYKFGFHSIIGAGCERNASIRTESMYDFTGVEAVKFSASYGVGTVAGDHLDVYISDKDYALNEGMLGNLSSIGARYDVLDLTGQGMHRFSVSKEGEHYLYMTAEQHAGSGWIYYYLYNQEFDGKDEGHVALELKEYTLKCVSPASLGSDKEKESDESDKESESDESDKESESDGSDKEPESDESDKESESDGSDQVPAGDVRLTLSADHSVTGESVSAYRGESFQLSYTQMDEAAHFAGYELVDSKYNSYYKLETECPTFTLTSEIIEQYSSKFTDDTIIIRPIFEYDEAEVKVLKQDFAAIDGVSLSATIDEEKGEAVYKDGTEEIATVKWDPSYKIHSELTFTVDENESYTGDYHFTAFKVDSGSSSTSPLTNPIYYSVPYNEWSITLEDGYYEITPIISNRKSRLLLNVTGATHGTFDGEPEDSTADEYTVEDYDGHYNANDIVIFAAKPDDGYRAKWSYHDVQTGETKTYYGSVFYYRVQVPMLMSDNYVSLEFEKCDTKKQYSVVADVYMQGGDLLHEPLADSDVYSAFFGAQVSLEGIKKESAEDGSAGTFTLNALPGETYTALVMANNRQYIQDVVIPTGDTTSVRQTMKLSYYYEGPRVTAVQYYSYDGTVQNGDVIYLSDEADSVILAAEIDKAGEEVTDVIFKLKDSNGTIKDGGEVTAERNGSQYIWSASLGMMANEGDQIWIELVKRETDSDGKVKSQISYGEVNTGYTIVIQDFTETYYIPDTGLDEDVSDVPLFGSVYLLLGVGVKFPTFTVSKSGGVTYLTIGMSAGGSKLLHKDGEKVNPYSWTSYKESIEKGVSALSNCLKGNVDQAKQTLKKKTLSVNFNISAQLALYSVVNEETHNSELVVVGAWLTFGVNGSFTYNYPFIVYVVPCFVCLTITGNFSDTIEVYARDPEGYTALQDMHDPTKSSYKSENDLKLDLGFSGSLGVGINGLADLAGGATGKFAFDWVDWNYGEVVFSATADLKLDLLIFGGNVSFDIVDLTIIDENPYTQESLQAASVDESQLMNEALSAFSMRPLESYNQEVNVSSAMVRSSLLAASPSSDVLISDAYEFSQPKMYSMGNDKYMIIATVDERNVSGTGATGETQSCAVLACAIYDAATNTYETDGQGCIFQSLEEANSGNERSINFHPSVTEIGETGKYLITWNSIGYDEISNLNLINARPVIKAAVYDSESESVVAHKTLVTTGNNNSMMSSTVLDTAYDEANEEVVVLYRALNLDGLNEDSKLSDYMQAGSMLLCTSVKMDQNSEISFSESVPIVSGGEEAGVYHMIKTADLAVMDGQPMVAYQMTIGEQANYLSTAEEGSSNHIYVSSLNHKEDGGYTLQKTKEVTEGISDQYHAQPQLLSYTMDGETYHILMWKVENGMATLNPVEFMKDSFTLGAVDENSAEQTAPSYNAAGTATIVNELAGIMGDYQIIQGADGKVYSIWTEGNGAGTGTKVMMAALEKFSDGCEDKTSVSWGTGSVVLETTDNSYVRAMSPCVDSNGKLHLLYRDTKIGDNESNNCNIVLKTINLNGSQLTVENYAQLSDEALAEYENLSNLELYVSELYPRAGEKLTIVGRVKNSGVQATEETELKLYADGIDTGERVTIPVMASGIEDQFTFTYQVPDDFDGSPIEFSVQGANNTKLVQSTSSGACMEVSNIKFDQLTYLDDDADSVSYNVVVSVTNTGNDVSEASTFVLSHIENGKENGEEVIKEVVFGSCDVPVVRPGEVERVLFQVDIPKEYFGENIFHLASVAGAIYYNYDPNNVEGQSMLEAFTDYVQAEEAPEVQTVTLAQSKKVGVGQSLNLKVNIAPATAKEFAGLTYVSSEPSIATVDENGIITGVKEGTCNVTVTTKNGIQKTTTIQVTKDAAADDDEEYNPSDKSGDDTADNKADNRGVPDQNDQMNIIKTGDHSPILPLAIVLIICGGVIVGIVLSKRRKNK